MNRYTVRYGVRMRSAMKANKYYNSGLRKSGCCYFFACFFQDVLQMGGTDVRSV